MQPVFTIKEALSFGWKKTVENLGFFALLMLSFMVVSVILDKADTDTALDALFSIVSMAFGWFASFTFVRVALKAGRGEYPRARDVFNFEWETFGWFALAMLITGIAYLIGFVALVIPGIILVVRLGMFSFALVDEDLKAIESIKRSLALTKGHFWKLLGLMAVIALINVAGALAFFVGLLVTAPLGIMATVYVYERLKAASIPAATVIETPAPTIPAAPVTPAAPEQK